MGKQQLSTLDVAAEAACLRRRVLGMNLINVFDINPKTYVLKLGTSGDDSEKVFVVLESGCRFHTTQYTRTHSTFPSNFNMKLRKHIRNRRLTDVRQLGIDRIVDFSFGHGDKCIHLILEIYSQGNIVLTDHAYSVLTLLRTYSDSDTNYALLPKLPYPVQHIRMSKPISEIEIVECFFRTSQQRSLKSIVVELLPFGSACAEHIIRNAELDPSDVFPSKEEEMNDPEALKEAFRKGSLLKILLKEIKKLESWFHDCNSNPPKGYILTKPIVSSRDDKEGSDINISVNYVEYEPFLLNQHQHRSYVEFEREQQKLNQAQASAQAVAETRLKKTRKDLEMRAKKLREDASNEELQGQLIEYNLELVDEVLLAINSVLARGMNWSEIEALIKEETELGNPVAGHIHSLQLEQNAATILLEDPDPELDEEGNQRKVKVTLDLSLGAAANARQHFDRRKRHEMKERRTQEANETAMKAAEKKVQSQLQKTKPSASMQPLKKHHWFEKFYWFITTENYLVISGRDARQNELLVKKYMKPVRLKDRKDDVYVHADLHGASSTIVKNYKPGVPVSPISLHQAGVACICRSKAWEGKVVTSAWWVFPDQVSKTAPTGEYLPTGSFMIRGKKNYLPHASLVFGFGFLFKLEEACIDGHKNDRLPKNDSITDPIGDSVVQTSAMVEEEAKKEEEDQLKARDEKEIAKSTLEKFMDESVDPVDRRRSEVEREPLSSTRSKRPSKKNFAERVKNSKKDKDDGRESNEKEGSESEAAQSEAPTVRRAKPGRRKKKGKGGDMDEEDYQLMAELLKSSGPKKTRQQRKEERKRKQAEKHANTTSLRNQPNPDEIQEVIDKATEAPFAVEMDSNEDNGIEKEFLEIEDIEDDEETEQPSSNIIEMRQLDALTGAPFAEDTLLYALPVCGPYDALLPYKYKVKLLPGTLKKGKAGKQAIELLIHLRDIPQRDLQLMKSVNEMEITNAMLGSVKLAMPGMQKIKQNQKSKKKKKSTNQN